MDDKDIPANKSPSKEESTTKSPTKSPIKNPKDAKTVGNEGRSHSSNSPKKLNLTITNTENERIVEVIKDKDLANDTTSKGDNGDLPIQESTTNTNQSNVSWASGGVDDHESRSRSRSGQRSKDKVKKTSGRKQKTSNKEKRYRSPPRYDTEATETSSSEGEISDSDSDSASEQCSFSDDQPEDIHMKLKNSRFY